MAWLHGQRLSADVLISEDFIRRLHRKMYDKVWSWAGDNRTSETNIGVPFDQISLELRQLIDDALHWHHNQVYTPDELAI